MEFKDILAISGMPGLYKYVAQSTRGIIVESLGDGKRMNASATSRVSALSEISMFTEGDDIALAEVFTKMYAHTQGKEAISHKESPETLKAYFADVRAGVGHQEGSFVVQYFGRRGTYRVPSARRGGDGRGCGVSLLPPFDDNGCPSDSGSRFIIRRGAGDFRVSPAVYDVL